VRKPSQKRLGLLRLIRDVGIDGLVYLPVQDSLTLEKYGLTRWDTLTVTMAARAGLIHRYNDNEHVCTPDVGGFVRLTEKGEALLAESEKK